MRRIQRVARQTSYESPMQTAVAGYLDGLAMLYPSEIAWDHPPNEGRRDVVYAQKLKRQGVKAGQPDLSIYLAGARMVLGELKALDGSISKDQWDRMEILDNLGFDLWVLAAATPSAAVDAVATLLSYATGPTLQPGLHRTVRPGRAISIPFEGRTVQSFYLWPAAQVVRLGKKSITAIINAEGKSSP